MFQTKVISSSFLRIGQHFLGPFKGRQWKACLPCSAWPSQLLIVMYSLTSSCLFSCQTSCNCSLSNFDVFASYLLSEMYFISMLHMSSTPACLIV
ncbi:hypothetical protein DUNSADRAFT_359 [Dunaliella salina]|uniref:Uncharacterized protein n=1 Tax=Dunaliella salina TaxID=3046 RepID=A0ABQ7FZ28_DUNSA|nr:hypothetical protein DUNSADRAFT_359 [Dunaliella salina]|eukprot:KAF5827608.1 hypothetical protein DUNSADRAFT_359 [Dunaliella salina]